MNLKKTDRSQQFFLDCGPGSALPLPLFSVRDYKELAGSDVTRGSLKAELKVLKILKIVQVFISIYACMV